MRGGIDAGDLRIRPPVVGVVELQKKYDPGTGIFLSGCGVSWALARGAFLAAR